MTCARRKVFVANARLKNADELYVVALNAGDPRIESYESAVVARSTHSGEIKNDRYQNGRLSKIAHIQYDGLTLI